MLRYGILSTLVAHYLYDCWLGSFVILHSPSWSNRIGAIAVSFWPIALGVWGWWKYGRKGLLLDVPVPETNLQPAYSGKARWWEAPSHTWNLLPPVLSERMRLGILALSIAILVGSKFIPLPQDCMEKLGKLSKSRAEIIEISNRMLQEQGKDPTDFHRITSLNVGGTESKYLLEHGDLKSVADLYNTEIPDVTWWSRYFRFGEKEEFRFTLDKEGRHVSWNHLVPLESEGASLDKEAALALAKKELRENHGVQLAREKMIQDEMAQQAHRRDHAFTFQRTDWHWGESELRTSITVQGNETMGFQRWVKVPEEWQRKEAVFGWKQMMVEQLDLWLGVGGMAILVFLFIVMIVRNILPWQAGFLVALVPTFLGLLDWLNGSPWFLANYDTTTPASFFISGELGELAKNTLLGYLSQAVMLSVTLGMMRWAFNWTWRDMVFWPSSAMVRRRLWLDALALSFLALAIWQMKGIGDALALGWLSPYQVATYNIPMVNTALPWFASLSNALSQAYGGAMDVALKVTCAVVVYRRFPKCVWAVLLLQPILHAAGEKTWGEFWLSASSGELQRLIGILLIWKIWKFHAPALFLAFALRPLVTFLETFIAKGGPAYQWQVLPVVIVILLFAFFAFRPMLGPTASDKVRTPGMKSFSD